MCTGGAGEELPALLTMERKAFQGRQRTFSVHWSLPFRATASVEGADIIAVEELGNGGREPMASVGQETCSPYPGVVDDEDGPASRSLPNERTSLAITAEGRAAIIGGSRGSTDVGSPLSPSSLTTSTEARVAGL